MLHTMYCAECEKAEATLKCVDEDLQFCRPCSAQLHGKKARSHHRVQQLLSAPTCDECEHAPAVVECLECGGRRKPLVFCSPCSARLHIRIARIAHIVSPLQGTPAQVDADQRIGIKNKISGAVSNPLQPRKVNSSKSEVKRTNVPVNRVPFNCGEDNTQSPSNAGIKSRRRRAIPEKLVDNAGASTDASSDSSSASESSDDDEEYHGVHRIKRGSISLEAFIVKADDDQMDADITGPEQNIPTQKGIIQRIKKMLKLGLHAETPDIEAQQALKNAQRLLTKYNLEQAEVLKGNLFDTSSLRGGMRVVELRTKGRTKQGRLEVWVHELGWLIADNFDTQYFTKGSGPHNKPLRVVFYGISHNADCAGYAFAATFNRICQMTAEYKLVKVADMDKENSLDLKSHVLNQRLHTRVARSNYRKGVIAGLEEAVRIAQQMRSRAGSPKAADLDEETSDREVCSGAKPISGDETPTKRCTAISVLVAHSKKVGDDFLKEKGVKVKLRTQPPRSTVWNELAFLQGKKDSKVIDINQKGIKGSKARKRSREA